MKTYSQYGEDLIVFDYFNGRIGTLLDLGANDGITFSNSRLMIENGWSGVLVEASPLTFEKLHGLYKNNNQIICVEKCLSKEKKNTIFYHNIYHNNPNAAENMDLLSTIDDESYKRTSSWGSFSEFEIECDTIHSVLDTVPYKTFDFISIDIEGVDLDILTQLDLSKLGVELMILEHNNMIKKEIIDYCDKFAINNVIFENNVNIILHK
jgi:FkbM family methyltransferase